MVVSLYPLLLLYHPSSRLCMVVTYIVARARINRYIYIYGKFANPARRGQLNKENKYFPASPFAPENLVSRDGFASPVPRHLAHLQTQAEYDAYMRDSSPFPRRRPFIYLNRHTPSGQCRVYRVTTQYYSIFFLIFVSLEMPLFTRIFVPLPYSLCMESWEKI